MQFKFLDMKKFTNKILIAIGVILFVCNIAIVSYSLNRYTGDGDDSHEMYDEYYYNDDDSFMNEETH